MSIVCQNAEEDRIIPRMARALRDVLGWSLGAAPDPHAEAVYLSAYFETQKLKGWPGVPVAAYFTHREEEPPNNAKARLYDTNAKRVGLRVATCRLYAEPLADIGPTIQAAAPLERERFTPPPSSSAKGRGGRCVVGLSGFTYANKRKGEDLVKGMVASAIGQRVEWRASGRGWPVPTRGYAWADMPSFYQGLDALVIPSRVEGIPMPPLEALACGVSVVIPRGVGLLDELPDLPGIHRYERGDLKTLLQALEAAVATRGQVDRGALRDVTAPYSVANWCRDVAGGIEGLLGRPDTVDGGIEAGGAETQESEAVRKKRIAAPTTFGRNEPVERGTGSARGIYCVAFGDPARTCALRMMESAKVHMPDVPIALVSDRGIGPEDVLLAQPDSDVGGRRAKLRAYELAPAEWQSVLYLDADTEVVAPVYQLFEWIEDGWEFLITQDVGETLHSFQRKNNLAELAQLQQTVGTLHLLQFNGGVWAFRRCEATERFFARWRAEWEVHAQRDQGALIRALYAEPLRIWTLGHEWNKFPKYTPEAETAGILHFPGDARRWDGKLPGRIDSPEAWARVQQFEGRRAELAPRRRR